MMSITIDVLGWIGSFLLILAYYQNSKGKITAQSTIYQVLNVVGSLCLIVNTLYYGAYPSGVVNIIWVFIGLQYLVPWEQSNGWFE